MVLYVEYKHRLLVFILLQLGSCLYDGGEGFADGRQTKEKSSDKFKVEDLTIGTYHSWKMNCISLELRG